MSVELRVSLQRVQNLLKRDPESYVVEFELYFAHFKKVYEVQMHNLSHLNNEFIYLMNFISSVIGNYKKYTEEFVNLIFEIIKNNGNELEPQIRLESCRILCKFRKEKLICPIKLVGCFITLFNCKDKALRAHLFKLILADFKHGSKKSQFGQSIKNQLQTFLYKRLSDNDYSLNIQHACVSLMTEMWRRNFWRDDRSANAISTAVFSSHYRISYLSLMAMKGEISKIKELDDSDDEELQEAATLAARDSKRPRVHGAARTAKKRQRQIKQTSRAIKRAELKHSNDQSNIGDTALIRLIYGPQEFAEKLFSRITKASNKFEFRLLGLEVLARIISVHKLIFPSFYQYCLKYLHPHQKGVVTIITTLAQASHELVPPEFITPVIERIANNFVSLQNAPEVCSVGINAIREIYFRVPLSVEAIIAQDLIQYARDRKAERSVVSAARSLLQLLRVVNPAVLSKKDKLYNTRDFEVKAYGSIDLHTTVPGAPFLSTSIDPVDSDWSDDESYSESHVIDAETCTSEILQDIDFKRLRILHKKTLLSEEGDDSSEGEQDEDNEIITNNNAIGSITSSKVSKCKAREERIKVNPHKGWRFNAKASTTNTEKKKNKPFAMAKNKFEVRKKKSRSFRERVSVLRRALDKKRRSKAKA